MVSKLSLLICAALLSLLALSCGSSSSSNQLPTPRATATARTTSGASANIDPRSGPAGTLVTISGSGWSPGVSITITAADLDPAQNSKPYAVVAAKADGSFIANFRLEKTPMGEDLLVGRYDLVAKAGNTSVNIMFLVETKRPVGGPVGGG